MVDKVVGGTCASLCHPADLLMALSPALRVRAGSNGGVNGNSQVGAEQTGLSSASLNAQTNTDAAKKKKVGVIPQESINTAGQLSSTSSTGGTSTAGTTGTAGTIGTITAAGTNTGTVVSNSNSMAGHIAVQPNTGGGINNAAG